jgi:serine phosphatase RsbU (regulator of sigma subunit)
VSWTPAATSILPRRRASCQRVVTGRGGLTSPLATTDPAAKVGRERPEREGSCWAADAYARWVSRRQGLRTADSVWAAAEAASPVEAVEAVTRELGQVLGATKVSFLIADLSGRALVRLAHVQLSAAEGAAINTPLAHNERRADEESATALPLDGGPAEQALRTQQVQVVGQESGGSGSERSGSWVALAPVTERGEAIGLLELTLPGRPHTDTQIQIARLAHLLAFVVIANRRHTDLYEWGQRTRPLSLSAEIQHRLLPGPQTCEAKSFTLAGWLEPAAAIAGDTFDFSLARDVLHLSLTDAMGHGVAAALAATLCVGSLRNARSAGASLLEQVALTNQALFEHAAKSGLEDFVTGLIGRVDLRTGSTELVNAGHVAPYLARGSHTRTVNLPGDVPLGMFEETIYRSTRLVLEPGDRIVLLTDGMVERNAVDMDFPAVIAETRALHPREAVRMMADRVLEATDNTLNDDATVLCLDWHGGHGRDRDSVHGAETARASRPLD